MKIDVIPLSICGGSLLLFIVIMITYMVRINKAKRNCSVVPKSRGSYWGVLISSVVLILLPVLVPMKTYFIVIVCCCAIMAELIAFRDRIAQLTGSDK
jgi:hypothetical protein